MGEPDNNIFENSEKYFQNEYHINKSVHLHYANFCYRTENPHFKSNLYLTNLCKKCVIILEKLKAEYSNGTAKYSKYSDYLNFWLTYKLTITCKFRTYITQFYEFIKNNYKAFSSNVLLKSKIYHIKCTTFNNMNVLYELYRYTRLSLYIKQGLPFLPNFALCKPSNEMNFTDKYTYHIYQLSSKKPKMDIPLYRKQIFSKSYCLKYDICNQELGKDLFTIKDNIQELLKYKQISSEEMDQHNSSNRVSFHVKEEDNASSNTTSINVGVDADTLFTLFFLYRFTPLDTWFNRTVLNRRDSMYNYDEASGQDYLDYNSDFDNYIPENSRYEVAYSAAW
ncbi:PIR Superfamily Protein [Plasmodium ovale wallikeri]|uniref:PIR Superfamily Protein n=1 Tax=Plasmodium ovale wallikeri TaxID=864142 RepID=A0A1A9A6T9_PLAOA|nr:PIR Superfamily Protein [Plasmodium ovale wallikeri]SBT59324.1 PIR Superfamily Protein [Plasmodium ovale wallikeri]